MITLGDVYREKAALRTRREDAWNDLRMALLVADALVPPREVRMALLVKVESCERTLEILTKQELELLAAGKVTDPSPEMAAAASWAVTDSRTKVADWSENSPPRSAAKAASDL